MVLCLIHWTLNSAIFLLNFHQVNAWLQVSFYQAVRDIQKNQTINPVFTRFWYVFLVVLREVKLSILNKMYKKRRYNKTILTKRDILNSWKKDLHKLNKRRIRRFVVLLFFMSRTHYMSPIDSVICYTPNIV